MTVEAVHRPGLADVDLPGAGEWTSFWATGRRYTIVADEPAVWTLLRHRTKAATTVVTFAESDAWFHDVTAGREPTNPAPSWRALLLRYV